MCILKKIYAKKFMINNFALTTIDVYRDLDIADVEIIAGPDLANWAICIWIGVETT